MAISKAYQETLKKRFISEFVKANGSRPTMSQLEDGLKKEFRKYSSVDLVGISALDLVKPNFHSVSSAEVDNNNRNALFDDLLTISQRVDDLQQSLEDSFRGFQASTSRTKRSLSLIESRLDNLLLLNEKADQFLYGIEETFDSQEFIDLVNSTAIVEAGFCTLGRKNLTPISIDKLKFSAATLSDKGFLASQGTSDISSLKEDDGVFWEYLVFTKYRRGRVSLILDIELDEPAFISEVRVTGNFVGVNQYTTLSVFYSLDGQTYTETSFIEQALVKNELSLSINSDNLKKIRLLFAKEVADKPTANNTQYIWVYSLDSIKLYTDSYKIKTVSQLFAGPYLITNEEGDPVNFTKAKLEACILADDNTSVNFYLSKDNTNWLAASYDDQSLSIVSFNDGSVGTSLQVVDNTRSSSQLVDALSSEYELNFSTDGLLNAYISSMFISQVPLRSIRIKRNIPGISIPAIYNAPSGWFYNDIADEYQTTVYIDLPEGRLIDFGPKGLFINGSLVRGKVQLNQGYSTIRVKSTNWREVSSGITKLSEFKAADPLYPYNHKYLIEGYTYSFDFSDERVYSGVDEYFGWLLQYVPPEYFNSSRYSGNLGIFTAELIAGSLYFKVKVDKSNSYWLQELFDLDWLVQRDKTNQLFVKAVLTSSEEGKTPYIDSFKVRVV